MQLPAGEESEGAQAGQGATATAAGAPVLLLHGQPGSARDWTAVIAAIGTRTRVMAIDRPGWDGRTRAGGLRASAEAALAALDRAGVERALLVGLSYGGAVAAFTAAEHPDRVAGLVLVSPAANVDSLEVLDRILAAPVVGYALSVALLSAAGTMLSLGRVRERLEAAYALPDEYLVAAARRLRNPMTWDAFVVEQRALLRDLPALEPRLESIRAPTTIVIGTHDMVVPVAAGRRLAAQIPGARLIEIDRGHHVLPAEHPRRLAEIIQEATAA